MLFLKFLGHCLVVHSLDNLLVELLQVGDVVTLFLHRFLSLSNSEFLRLSKFLRQHLVLFLEVGDAVLLKLVLVSILIFGLLCWIDGVVDVRWKIEVLNLLLLCLYRILVQTSHFYDLLLMRQRLSKSLGVEVVDLLGTHRAFLGDLFLLLLDLDLV